MPAPQFHIPDGVKPTDPFVTILDPACGTGTFLVEVIDVIHRTMTEKWKAQGHGDNNIQALWNDYVPKHLLPRLYGYELMMAPYAIAHMKLPLKLKETGFTAWDKLGDDTRVRIYLTNSLEPPSDLADSKLADLFGPLAREAQEVNYVKRNKRFTVVIGNPPYAKSSQNKGQWIQNLMEDYKHTVRGAETQIQALSDDYSKFIRFGHSVLQESGNGVLGYITNNSYLDGPLFRDMRSSMLSFFNCIRILDLHGDARKRFPPPEGKADENVFDIQQGVATSLWTRTVSSKFDEALTYAEVWGTREEKYAAVMALPEAGIESQVLKPKEPQYLFVPVVLETQAEFDEAWHLYDVFGTGNPEVDDHLCYGAGLVTQQDKFAIAFEKQTLWQNIREFLSPAADENALWQRFKFCTTNQWSFDRARKELPRIDLERLTKQCLYRPFDYRYTVLDRNVCTILRKRITSQFDSPNSALLTTRRVTRPPFNNVFVANTLVEYKVASHDRNTIVFPLWINDADDAQQKPVFYSKRRLNFSPGFLKALASSLGLQQARPYGQPEGLTPEDIFRYAYAVFHSPTYRSRYEQFLKIDFPRLPLTSSLDLFRALAKLGGELVALHLLESPKLNDFTTTYTGPKNPEVARVGWLDDTVWLDAAATKKGQAATPGTIGFHGVPENVWNFHIGGYQVCHKWLKDRKGRQLSDHDITHYQKIVVALNETIRLMAEIDKVIEAHGGWPGAFTPGAHVAARP